MAKKLFSNNLFLFCVTFFVVFLSRLPFLLPGYGMDPDAWGVAYAARDIALTGVYHSSRLPGYPFQEFLSSLFWQGGPLLLNGTTAMFSGLAAAFIAMIIKKMNYQQPFFSGLFFAFIPVIYINSVNSIDYVWAISLILGGIYFLLEEKPVIAGLFLGLAIGTRITSVLMLLPFVVLWMKRTARGGDALKIMVAALVVGAGFFLPVMLKYGNFLKKIEVLSAYQIKEVIRLFTTDIWGYIGFVAFLLAIIYLFVKYLILRKSVMPQENKAYLWIWAGTIAMYFIVFLKMPLEAGYLIPALPFALFIFNILMSRRAFILFGIGILCSPFLVGVTLGFPTYLNPSNPVHYSMETDVFRWRLYVQPFLGPVISDHELRIAEIKRFDEVISFANGLKEKSVIIVGWHISKFDVLGLQENHNKELVTYAWMLTQNDVVTYVDQSYKIYYLPEIQNSSIAEYGVDFQRWGGIPLPYQ